MNVLTKSCYTDETITCSQCNTKNLALKFLEFPKGKEIKFFSESNHIFLISKGSFVFTYKKLINKEFGAGETLLIPMQSTCFLSALSDVSILIMKLEMNDNLYEHFSLELLSSKYESANKDDDIGCLKSNSKLLEFSNIIRDYQNDGIGCSYFFDLKIREFFFLINTYYNKSTVFNFFKPIYSSDFIFSNAIFKNLEYVRTVKDMAAILRYSLSGFEKKFKRVFNASPYKWMQEQKAKKIYHEIICTKKTFTQIAFEFEFSSPAHFNDYCKQFFDNTPGGLRKKVVGTL